MTVLPLVFFRILLPGPVAAQAPVSRADVTGPIADAAPRSGGSPAPGRYPPVAAGAEPGTYDRRNPASAGGAGRENGVTNVVVTGGAGFVGSRLARELLAAGSLDLAGGGANPLSRVTLIDRSPAPADLAADGRVAAIRGDLGELLDPGRAGWQALA